MRNRIGLASMLAILTLLLLSSIAIYAQSSVSPKGDCTEQCRQMQPKHMQAKPGAMHGMRMQNRGAMGMDFKFLKLTPDQKKQMMAILKTHKTETEAIQSKMAARRMDMMRLLSEKSLDRGKINAAVKDINDLRGQMMTTRMNRLIQAHEVLTPEQREKLSAKLQKMEAQGMAKGFAMGMCSNPNERSAPKARGFMGGGCSHMNMGNCDMMKK